MCWFVFLHTPLDNIVNSALPACGCVVRFQYDAVSSVYTGVFFFKKKLLFLFLSLHGPTVMLDRIKSWHLNVELRAALHLHSSNAIAGMDFVCTNLHRFSYIYLIPHPVYHI